MFTSPAINVYSHDVTRLAGFYEGLGFRETFRTPKEGTPVHVEVGLDGFTIGIAAVDAAIEDHGLSPNLNGRPVEIVLWTDDVDRDYARLTGEGRPFAQRAARFPVRPPPRLDRRPGRQPDPAGAEANVTATRRRRSSARRRRIGYVEKAVTRAFSGAGL